MNVNTVKIGTKLIGGFPGVACLVGIINMNSLMATDAKRLARCA